MSLHLSYSGSVYAIVLEKSDGSRVHLLISVSAMHGPAGSSESLQSVKSDTEKLSCAVVPASPSKFDITNCMSNVHQGIRGSITYPSGILSVRCTDMHFKLLVIWELDTFEKPRLALFSPRLSEVVKHKIVYSSACSQRACRAAKALRTSLELVLDIA